MSGVAQYFDRKWYLIAMALVVVAMLAVFFVTQDRFSATGDHAADGRYQDLQVLTEQLSEKFSNDGEAGDQTRGKKSAADDLQVILRSDVLPVLRQQLLQESLLQQQRQHNFQLIGVAILATGLLGVLALVLTSSFSKGWRREQQVVDDTELGFVDPAHVGEVLVSMDQGIVAWNGDLEVEIYNERVVELLNLPPGFMRVGLTLEALIEHARSRGDYDNAKEEDIAAIIQQQRDKTESTVERVLSNGRVIRVNVRRRAHDGMVATYTDITELRKQTERVRRQKAVVETILENLDQGVSLLDDDLTVVAFNRRYLELFDIPEGSVQVGDHLRKFCEIYVELGHYGRGDPETQVREHLEFARKNKNLSYRRHLANGRFVDIYNAPLPSGGVVTTYRDVTERLRYEQDLEEARDKAEAASRSKSEFLANMSHEIRTPMNGVLGMAELLADDDLNEQQASYVKIISESGSALLTIINDILDFSKIEAGKLELNPEPFNLRSAVEGVAVLMANSAAEKSLELMVRVNPALPDHVIGDAGRIRQIVTNLVGNAVKFTKEGHVLIEVDGAVAKDQLRLQVSVKDTGIGLAETELARIFDKFEQADNTTTRRYGGTGLGLAISKQLVELMGGQIGADSAREEGSTFWFTLSLPVDVQAAARRKSVHGVHGAKMLIVDDVELNRKILAEQAESWGMTTQCAASAAEALEVLACGQGQGRRFDLAVLDYQMPDTDGAELAQQIKENPATRDIALIMLSSVDGKGDARKIRQAGVAETLVKPVRSSLLLESIAKVLTGETAGSLPPKNFKSCAPEVAKPLEAIDPQRGEFNLILAEDNKINRYVVMQMLAGTAYNLTIAVNGREAVELWQAGDTDLIFMDISMPEMDGYEATAMIRTLEEQGGRSRVPIVCLTAHTMQGDRERCLASGMDDYLAKPVQQQDLEAMLTKWLGGGRQRQVKNVS